MRRFAKKSIAFSEQFFPPFATPPKKTLSPEGRVASHRAFRGQGQNPHGNQRFFHYASEEGVSLSEL